MECGEKTYIWESADWPNWRYDAAALLAPCAAVHRAQGHLAGRISTLGVGQRDETTLRAYTTDVLKTSEIEGETLNADAVRSSVARRLGVDIGAVGPEDRHVDGVVEMVMDATQNHGAPLTTERLCGWHAALFPTGHSGLRKINTARWRDDRHGPMQVLSGPVGRERVHYEAPPAGRVDTEMRAFLRWFNGEPSEDRLLRAGLAHLWFVTVHPFDDGNGRIARAIGDMALARAEQSAQRYYSVSAQIQRERQTYYELLERTQKGTLDVTLWLLWFLECVQRAVAQADAALSDVLARAGFWQRWSTVPMNERQARVLNRLLDGFEGHLTNRKWAAISKSSADTALRDLTELVDAGVLRKEGSGRSTRYVLTPA